MSVFLKNKPMKPTGHEKHMPCNQYHMIDGQIPPTIDPSIHSTQNKSLMGKICDCRKQIYSENMCGCPLSEEQKWEIKWVPNPSY